MPLTLSEEEIVKLKGINEDLVGRSCADLSAAVTTVELLYQLQPAAAGGTGAIPRHRRAKIPYVIGIAGSVAVGKSTTARLLQALLSRWPEHRSVELITTDGFLHPNKVLNERGLMKKKASRSLTICIAW